MINAFRMPITSYLFFYQPSGPYPENKGGQTSRNIIARHAVANAGSARRIQKGRRFAASSQIAVGLQRALNLIGTQAAGAGIDVAGGPVYKRLDALYVGLPRPVGASVRVRNPDSERYAFTADIAFCHVLHLLYLFHSVFKVNIGILSDLPDECKGFFAKFSF